MTGGAGVASAGLAGGSGITTADHNSIRWEFEAESWLAASPTMVNRIVYAGYEDGTVYAVDGISGEELWRFETEGSWSSQTVEDGTIYVGSNNGRLYALNAESGEERWRFETGANGVNSPTVADGSIYIRAGDSLYAVNIETGDEQWRFTDSDMEANFTVADDIVCVDLRWGILVALDPDTGDEQWRFEVETNTVIGQVVVNDTVFFADYGPGWYTDKLYAVNIESGEERWTARLEQFGGGPTVVDGTVYVVRGPVVDTPTLRAIDAESGKGQWRVTTEYSLHGAPVVNDGLACVGAEDGRFYGIATRAGITRGGEDDGSGDTGLEIINKLPYVVFGIANLLSIVGVGLLVHSALSSDDSSE
jgi:outer membrane protein assembly factor BamB